MSKLNLRLTHKANTAFREILGDVLATTLEPFCRERKVEVVYDLSPDDVPFGSIHSLLANHSATGRTGKALDRIKKKVGDFMGEHAIEVISEAFAPLASVVAAPEAPVAEAPADMSDVLDAVNALGEEAVAVVPPPTTADLEADAPKVEAAVAVVKEAVQAEPEPQTALERIQAKRNVPRVAARARLANLYNDIKKGKKGK